MQPYHQPPSNAATGRKFSTGRFADGKASKPNGGVQISAGGLPANRHRGAILRPAHEYIPEQQHGQRNLDPPPPLCILLRQPYRHGRQPVPAEPSTQPSHLAKHGPDDDNNTREQDSTRNVEGTGSGQRRSSCRDTAYPARRGRRMRDRCRERRMSYRWRRNQRAAGRCRRCRLPIGEDPALVHCKRCRLGFREWKKCCRRSKLAAARVSVTRR